MKTGDIPHTPFTRFWSAINDDLAHDRFAALTFSDASAIWEIARTEAQRRAGRLSTRKP